MRHAPFALATLAALALAGATRAGEPEKKTARDKGLAWLTKNQLGDGSWGKQFEPAETSLACLAYVAARDEPFQDDADGKALARGVKSLLARQKDGDWKSSHWIHCQGFATLALAEVYSRSLVCRTKPDLDAKALRATLEQAVKLIEANQSTSGGWWYTPGCPGQHEGSTTVCAVQAIVAVRNAGIAVDEKVLASGFNYLKKCQAKDGGFNYQLGDGRSMREGTCADVATLGLMKKFDYSVMINGYKFMKATGAAGIATGSFVEYGQFYGTLGMELLGQEYQDEKEYRESSAAYIDETAKLIVARQRADGSWPLQGWMGGQSKEEECYATAFATLTLSIGERRLGIFNRTGSRAQE